MDPIYELPADLPFHDPAPIKPVAHRIVTTWPVGTFVENAALLPAGDLAVSVHSTNTIESIDLTTGIHTTVAQLPVCPTGLVVLGDMLYAASGFPGQSPQALWQITADGTATARITVTDALFLNGLTPFTTTSLLAADSLLGRIYRLDLDTQTATVWFEDELLRKITTFPFMPGANGLKIHKGYAYVTNTDRALFVRIPIQADGSAGPIEIVAEHLRGDDFAFDSAGNAYITTHIENTLERLAPDGTRTALAGPEQGMPGSTSIVFIGDGAACVTTTGGILAPFDRVLQPAKLLRLELGVEGQPVLPITLPT